VAVTQSRVGPGGGTAADPADPAVPSRPAGTDPHVAARRRYRAWLAFLLLALVGVLVVGVGAGAVAIGPGTVLSIVGHHTVGYPEVATWSGSHDAIVWDVRLPRVLLGAFVGAGLAVCGVAMQAMVRNVLADPYLLGVNSGASSGAAAAILFGVGAGLGEYALQGSAFIGALVACLVVFMLARTAGSVTSVRLLLAGVAVGYALSAATSFLIFASDSAEGSRSVLFWLLGSLGLAQWNGPLAVVVVVVASTVLVLAVLGRRLDALAIGEDTARTLGVSPTAFRSRLLVLVALCVGVVVSASGSIGFVGLVMPHVARRLVGSVHSRVVPIAALLGAVFLVLADIFARMALAPQEIPIGIVTALFGTPLLIVLIRRLHVTG
jgi:iron complex transport system permease protein